MSWAKVSRFAHCSRNSSEFESGATTTHLHWSADSAILARRSMLAFVNVAPKSQRTTSGTVAASISSQALRKIFLPCRPPARKKRAGQFPCFVRWCARNPSGIATSPLLKRKTVVFEWRRFGPGVFLGARLHIFPKALFETSRPDGTQSTQ